MYRAHPPPHEPLKTRDHGGLIGCCATSARHTVGFRNVRWWPEDRRTDRARARKGDFPRLPRGTLRTVPGCEDLCQAFTEPGITAAHPGEKIKAFASLKGATTALAAAECKTRSARTDGNAGGVARGHPWAQGTALPGSSYPARQDTSCLASGGRERGCFPAGTALWGLSHPVRGTN